MRLFWDLNQGPLNPNAGLLSSALIVALRQSKQLDKRVALYNVPQLHSQKDQ